MALSLTTEETRALEFLQQSGDLSETELQAIRFLQQDRVDEVDFGALRRLGAQFQTQDPILDKNALENLAAGINRGVLRTAGLPGDAAVSALKLLGLDDAPVFRQIRSMPSEALQAGGELLFGEGSATPDPGSVLGTAGEFAGEAVGFTLPLVGGAARLARPEVAGGLIGATVREAARQPGKFLSGEAIISAGAGAGSEVAENPITGSLVGAFGTAGAKAGIEAAARAVARSAESLFQPETVVARALQSEAVDPDAAVRRVSEPAPIQAAFTPLAKSGDPGLLILDRKLATGPLSREMLLRRNEINAALRQQIEKAVGRGVSQEFVDFAARRSERLIALADQRIAFAAAQAERTLQELPPQVLDTAPISRVFRRHLAEAVQDLKAQERQKWTLALGSETVPIGSAQGAVAKVDKITRVAEDGLPVELREKAARLDVQYKDSGAIPIDEIQALRSRALELGRTLGSGETPNRRQAALVDEFADGLLEQMRGTSVSEEIDDAIRFSKVLQERFFKGPVGDLMQLGRSGAPQVPAMRAIDELFVAGIRGGENADALLAAVGDRAGALEVVEQFVATKFAGAVLDGGNVDPLAAKRFIANHHDFLSRFPPLRRTLEGARESADFEALSVQAKALTERELSRERMHLFARGDDPIKTMKMILSGRGNANDMRAMVEQAAEDPSGRALRGLQSLVAETFVKMIDDPITDLLKDGAAVRFLDNNRRALGVAFETSPGALKRLEAIVKSLQLQWNAVNRGRANVKGSDTAEIIQGNVAGGGLVVDVLAAITGARLFARLGGQLGASRLQSAARGSAALRGILANQQSSTVQALFERAVLDEEVFKTMMMRDLPENFGPIRNRLNAHLGALGLELTEQENEQQ